MGARLIRRASTRSGQYSAGSCRLVAASRALPPPTLGVCAAASDDTSSGPATSPPCSGDARASAEEGRLRGTPVSCTAEAFNVGWCRWTRGSVGGTLVQPITMEAPSDGEGGPFSSAGRLSICLPRHPRKRINILSKTALPTSCNHSCLLPIYDSQKRKKKSPDVSHTPQHPASDRPSTLSKHPPLSPVTSRSRRRRQEVRCRRTTLHSCQKPRRIVARRRSPAALVPNRWQGQGLVGPGQKTAAYTGTHGFVRWNMTMDDT